MPLQQMRFSSALKLKWGAFIGMFILLLIVFFPWKTTTDKQFISPVQMLFDVFYSKNEEIHLPEMDLDQIGYETKESIGIKHRGSWPQEIIAKYYRTVTALIETYDKDNALIGRGSGFVITRDGVLITNHHVLAGAHSATVKISGSDEIYRKVFWLNKFLGPELDMALIKIDANNLLPALIGNSNDAVVGEDILAIGNPEGFEGSVSKGVISSFRELGKITLMQISAPISPGSSGGPVVNMFGEVIGVATLSSRHGEIQNINFAVPIDHLKITRE